MTNKSPTTSRAVDIQVPGDTAPAADQGQAVDAQPVRRTRPQEDAATEVIKERVGALLDEKMVEQEQESDPLPAMTRRSYAKMRADDIDATKLTAPVMTLDGWLCPPAPEKK